MHFSLIGLNHRTAPVEVREQLCFQETALPQALQAVASLPGVHEAMILSTCNRVEILARSDAEQGDVTGALVQFLAHYHQRAHSQIEPYLYRFQQADVIRHIFRVASSLDSMIIGETQILGQVKEAYAQARTVGTLRGPLDEALTRAFHVAKRVRTETGIASSAVSVSYAAVELAKKIFGSLNDKKILLIGAGKMSELAAKHLVSSGGVHIYVTNRSPERATEMAAMLHGRAVPFDQMLTHAAQCDIILTSTGAPNYLITMADAQRLLSERKNRPMFMIDIAVPRNIDPAINKLDNIFLYDIDDLQQVVDSNMKERMREAQAAEQIAEQETDKFLKWLKTLEVVPTIIDLQSHLEEMRQQEMTRVSSQLSSLTPEQREAVDALTRGMMHKVLHSPIHHLKTLAQQPDGLKLVETVRKIFNLKQ
ncbi:MAG: glutamyl-tRNA reductase [Acidobacteria bacterium]|nr:glutamyl-tRNA reductase [Acidobacteriota bacterium]